MPFGGVRAIFHVGCRSRPGSRGERKGPGSCTVPREGSRCSRGTLDGP
jgi:hypothetical protein